MEIEDTSILAREFAISLERVREFSKGVIDLENAMDSYEEIINRFSFDKYTNSNLKMTDFCFYHDVIKYLQSKLLDALVILKALHFKAYRIKGLSIKSLIKLASIFEIKKYNKICAFFKECNIEEVIERALREKYRDNRYFIFTPGSFYLMFKRDIQDLRSIGYTSVADNLEKKLKPLIDNQELASQDFMDAIKNSDITLESFGSEEYRDMYNIHIKTFAMGDKEALEYIKKLRAEAKLDHKI